MFFRSMRKWLKGARFSNPPTPGNAQSPGRSPLALEPLEPRELLSTTTTLPVHYLAPATLAGGTFAATVATGVAPLATTGTYTLLSDHSGGLTGTATDGTAIDDSYDYRRINLNTGVLRFTDPTTGTSYADTLTFANGTTGTFSLVAMNGAAGAQTGSFNFTAAPQPIGADVIANFLKVPNTGTVSAGDTTTIVVNVANIGSQGAVGFITVNLYLSPTGFVDSHSISLTSIGQVMALGLQASTNIGRQITFADSIPSGTYYVVATLTPSVVFSDTDRSNDIAVSTVPFHLTSPGTTPVTPTPVTLTGSIFGTNPTTLTGDKLTIVVVQLSSNYVASDGSTTSASFEGSVPINLVVTPQGGGSPIVLTAVQKKIAIGVGQSPTFPIRVLVPTSLTTGQYSMVVQIGPSATREPGITTPVKTAPSPLSDPISVNITQPPVAIFGMAIGTLPSNTLTVNQRIVVPLTLSNTGDAIAIGTYSVRLYAAPIGNPDAIKSIIVSAAINQKLVLKPDTTTTINLVMDVPRKLTLLAPSYNLVAVLNATDIVNVTATSFTATSSQLFTVSPG